MAAVDSDDDALGAPMFLPAPAFAPPSRHVASLPLPAEVRSHLLPYKPGRMSIDPAAIPVSIQVDWSDGELDDDDYPVIGGAVADDDDLNRGPLLVFCGHDEAAAQMRVPCAPPPVLAIAARTPPGQRRWTRVPAGVSMRSRVAMSIEVPIEPSEEGTGRPEARSGTGIANSGARRGHVAAPAPGLASPPPASATSRRVDETARDSPTRSSVAAAIAGQPPATASGPTASASAGASGAAAASAAPAPASGAPVPVARAAAAQNERARIFDVIAAAQAQYERVSRTDEKGADRPDAASAAESTANGVLDQASGGTSGSSARGSTACGATTAAALAASRRRQRRLGAAGGSSGASRNPGQPLIPSQTLLAKARPAARAAFGGSG